jgi:hypothetical protein
MMREDFEASGTTRHVMCNELKGRHTSTCTYVSTPASECNAILGPPSRLLHVSRHSVTPYEDGTY